MHSSQKNTNIALFGGAFDPVHKGHLHVAETTLALPHIDKVWFIPAANPPHKDNCMFTFNQRITFLKNAIAYNDAFSVYEKDYRNDDKSYTIYLIKELKQLYPEYEFSFIIGADNVTKMQTWYALDELLSEITFIVVDRDTNDKHLWKDLYYYHQLVFTPSPTVDISSSEIKKTLLNIVGAISTSPAT